MTHQDFPQHADQPDRRSADRPARRLYFDNAATSFPKPPAVLEAMTRYATELGASPGRGAYREARESGAVLTECRRRINRLIGGTSAEHVVFTLNTSDALNLAIRGLVRPGDHVVTTAMDHNSVLRPFNALVEQLGARQTVVPVDRRTGLVDPSDVRRAIEPKTRLVAAVHASNVSGTVQPIGEIGSACRELAVPLLVDAAQSIGHIPIDVGAMSIDLLAFPGHKGLLGPLGTGGLYIRPGLEKMMRTCREGGTGSVSERDVHPETMPDKFEVGSHNAVGIAGLSEGVAYLLERGIDDVWAHERSLIELFVQGLSQGDGAALPGLRVLGPPGVRDRVGVFSVVVDGLDPGRLSSLLEERYGVLTRSGLHCAPHAHRTFGTHPESRGGGGAAAAGGAAGGGGSTRFSVGVFVTPQDVKYATDALAELCDEHARRAIVA